MLVMKSDEDRQASENDHGLRSNVLVSIRGKLYAPLCDTTKAGQVLVYVS